MRGHEEEIRRRVRVVGRVQGVGFRWWTLNQARALGLRGTVRNCPDGSVEVAAAGPPQALERLHSLLADGPRAAHVEHIEELDRPPNDLPDPFDIVR